MKIVGYVYGKNVVGKPINQVMVSYIGLKDDEKKIRKDPKSLDLYWFLFVRSSMRKRELINNREKKNV